MIIRKLIITRFLSFNIVIQYNSDLCHNSPPFPEVYYTIYAENWLIGELYLFVIMTMKKYAFIVPVSCLLP